MARKPTTKAAVAETVIPEVAAAPAPAPAANAVTVASANVQAELVFIQKMLTNPKVDVKKLRELLNMRNEARADEARMIYNRAMRDAQQEIEPIARDAQGENSKYAKLEDIDRLIRPIYTKHGFSLSFNNGEMPIPQVRVLCTVAHIDGHSEMKQLDGYLDNAGPKGIKNKTDMQGLGSSVSYLRRYLTCMIFNVVLFNEDDDAARRNKAAAANDKFTSKVNEQAKNPPKVSDAKFTDVIPPPDAVIVPVPVHLADETQNKKFKSAKGAAGYLGVALDKMPDKKQRTNVLLDNTHILKLLEAQGEKETITKLHAIANGTAHAE